MSEHKGPWLIKHPMGKEPYAVLTPWCLYRNAYILVPFITDKPILFWQKVPEHAIPLFDLNALDEQLTEMLKGVTGKVFDVIGVEVVPKGRVAELEAELAEAEASPSLPDVKSPEALRFAADVVAATSSGGLPEHVYCSADDLRVMADELVAKTARDHVIDQAAKAMYEGYNRGSDWAKASAASHDLYRRYARDLADAGLLRKRES